MTGLSSASGEIIHVRSHIDRRSRRREGQGVLRRGAETARIDLPQRRRDFVRLWQRGPALLVNAAERAVPDDPKSGLHFCFTAPSRQSVEAFHKAAMAHGGRDNGKPGLRKDCGPHYYAAFVHDPEGYRLEAYYGGK